MGFSLLSGDEVAPKRYALLKLNCHVLIDLFKLLSRRDLRILVPEFELIHLNGDRIVGTVFPLDLQLVSIAPTRFYDALGIIVASSVFPETRVGEKLPEMRIFLRKEVLPPPEIKDEDKR